MSDQKFQLRTQPAYDSDDEPTTFSVTPIEIVAEDDHVCSNPDCDRTSDLPYARILGCDVEAMVADWAAVPFCSEDCIEDFADLGTLVDVKDEKEGTSTLVYAQDAREKVEA